MAEFVEVMKKYKKMCDCYKACGLGCPLNEIRNKHGVYCDDLIKRHPEEAEETIMAWEKPIDWSKVEVDTKILVGDFESVWHKRYFAKFKNGKVYAWKNGKTSFTAVSDNDIVAWNFAKLAEEGEQNG